MTVTDVAVHAYEAPLARPYVSATARHETRRGWIIQLETDDGVTGLGESAPLSNRTETPDQARQALLAAARSIEDDPRGPSEVLDALDATLPALAEAPTARFAVELALLDLISKRAGQPLAGWLAAKLQAAAAAPADEVPVNATIPACSLDETAKRARAAARAGFSTIKLKATGSFDQDADRVQVAREALGPDPRLRLDVNGAWPDPETALDRMDTLAPHDLEYVEQPLSPDAVDGMARLRRDSPVPVAADEPVLDLESARGILERGAADVLVCKPMVLGGPLAALEIAQAAQTHEVPVVVTSTIDGAVGRAGALHTAAALGERPLACGLATGALFEREPAAFDERIAGGRLAVPTAAGHGAWIDEPLEEVA